MITTTSISGEQLQFKAKENLLFGDPTVRKHFMRHHADLFDPKLWQKHKDHLLKGELPDFFPYDQGVRFCVRYPERFGSQAGDATQGMAGKPPAARAA